MSKMKCVYCEKDKNINKGTSLTQKMFSSKIDPRFEGKFICNKCVRKLHGEDLMNQNAKVLSGGY